jgi:hypothetical protein
MRLKIKRFEWLPVVQCHRRSALDENRSIVLKIWSVGTLRSICVVSKHCSLDILSNFEYHLSDFCLFLCHKWRNKNLLKCRGDQHRGPVSDTRASCSGFYRVPLFSQRTESGSHGASCWINTWGCNSRGKPAGTWSWPHTPIKHTG